MPEGKPQPRRRPAAAPPTAAQLAQQSSASMEELVQGVRTKAGGDPHAAMSDDIGKTLIGIPLPSLSLEYAFANSVLPLEKVVQLYGKKGSCKSAFGFEIMRWFRCLGGIGNLNEHESKYNADWSSSIIGWDERCMGVFYCHSVNDWQKRLQEQLAFIQKKMKGTGAKDKGIGKIFPYLQIVDSIMGKPSQETQDKIEQEGSAGRSWPVEAMSIGRFITTYSTKMHGWPVLLLCVNHMKVMAGDKGIESKNRSGGQTIDFQGAFELEVSKIGNKELATSTINRLAIKMAKNSYGPDQRRIEVDVAWWDEKAPPNAEGRVLPRQKTMFDWDGSTVKMILAGKGALWNDIRKMTGIVAKNASMAHSIVLGEKEPVPYRVLGRKIHQHPKLMQDLRDMLGVRMRRTFRPGVDYDQQAKDLKRHLAASGELNG